ncbi:mucin-2-like [Malaya genurostris]|uniref:mucin-2-like n=1 Tax=Malaya genurostris TaxID=325434 RepID=UPI0026F3D21F|nr:mucin-2-like [Malaya genurostris]
MIGMCPSEMTFDETQKHCVQTNETLPNTVRVYDESHDCDVMIPNCNEAGIFPVPSNCTFFFDCQEYPHGYHQYVFKCPFQTMFHPDLHRCIPMTRCYHDQFEIFNHFSGEYFPKCTVRGQFRTSNDCNLYYRCIPNMDGSFFQIRYECPPTMQYSIERERCVPRYTENCYYMPLDKIILDYTERHNISYDDGGTHHTTSISTINTTITTNGPCTCTTPAPTSECFASEISTPNSLPTSQITQPSSTITTSIPANTANSEATTTPIKTHTPETTAHTRISTVVTTISTMSVNNSIGDLTKAIITNQASTYMTDAPSEETTEVTDTNETYATTPSLVTDSASKTSVTFQSSTTVSETFDSTVSTSTITDISEQSDPISIETFSTSSELESTALPTHQDLNSSDIFTSTTSLSPTESEDSDSFEYVTWDDDSVSRNKFTPKPATTLRSNKPRVRYIENSTYIFPDSKSWENSFDEAPDADCTINDESCRSSSIGLSILDNSTVTESSDSITGTSSPQLNEVQCFCNDKGGLTCDGVEGLQKGVMEIPGYILRIREITKNKCEKNADLNAIIVLRLRYPNSYRIEAVAKKCD